MKYIDRPREECGIFGIFDHPEASHLTYLGLYALQHRGQESAGIVSSDRKKLCLEKGMGYVADIFSEPRLEKLSGDRVGHWSIRINSQWRVCFRFENGHAYDVEIVDYH